MKCWIIGAGSIVIPFMRVVQAEKVDSVEGSCDYFDSGMLMTDGMVRETISGNSWDKRLSLRR